MRYGLNDLVAGRHVATGDIDPLPGCGQVAVSHNSFVYAKERGKGYGSALHMMKLDKCSQLGFDYILCTVAEGNKAEKHILACNGWKRLESFRSRKTDHVVEIWGRPVGLLTEEEIKP